MIHPAALQALGETRRLLSGHPTDPEVIRRLQTTIDALETAKAEIAYRMQVEERHVDDGHGSMKAWLRAELHLDGGEASRTLAGGRTLQTVAEPVLDGAREGRIRPGHVAWFGYGLTHLGAEVVAQPALADVLVQTAITAEPAQLKATVREIRDQLFPEALDEAWVRGMDKQDLKVSPVGEFGWALTGFLSIGTGAKLDTILRSLSAPHGPDDERSPAERRVDGLDTLLTSALENGLPQDRGVRPHLDVLVDHDELRKVATTSEALTSPAHLAGFGSIGRGFLSELLCGADITPVLTGGKDGVLDVGRTIRCATSRQRRAVNARQGGQCAAPGCTAPIVHLHHVVWFSHGGPSDLANYIGLCPRCHSLVHSGKLEIDADTHAFTSRNRPPVRSNRSNGWLTRRRARERLQRAVAFAPTSLPQTA